jgi:hypothetical protein
VLFVDFAPSFWFSPRNECLYPVGRKFQKLSRFLLPVPVLFPIFGGKGQGLPIRKLLRKIDKFPFIHYNVSQEQNHSERMILVCVSVIPVTVILDIT